MTVYKPSKKTKYIWWIRSLLIIIAVFLLTIWVSVLTPYVLILPATVIFIALLFDFVYLPLYLKNYKITVSDGAIILSSGVFIKTERIMPFPRLVYAEKIETPFGRAAGISAIVFRAARVEAVTAELDKKQADEVIGRITK